MKENLYRSMMEQIQLSDDADRRIRTALEQEVRRKRRHPLGRAGLAAAVAALLITTALGAQLLKSAVFVPHLGPQAGQWEEYVSGDTFAQCQAGRNAISVVSTLFTANSVNLIVEITPLDEAGQGALEENMLHCELQIHKPDGTLCVGYDTSFWNHPDTEAAEGLSFSRSVVVLPPETAGTRRLSLSFKTSYTGIAPGDQVTLEFSLGEDQASCTGTVQTVDASALVIPIAGSSWAQATVTPLHVSQAADAAQEAGDHHAGVAHLVDVDAHGVRRLGMLAAGPHPQAKTGLIQDKPGHQEENQGDGDGDEEFLKEGREKILVHGAHDV